MPTVAEPERPPRARPSYGVDESESSVAAGRPSAPSTLPIVASVRQAGCAVFVLTDVIASATRSGVRSPGLGNATPQETISLLASSTGLSFSSSEASAFRTAGVVGIFMA